MAVMDGELSDAELEGGVLANYLELGPPECQDGLIYWFPV